MRFAVHSFDSVDSTNDLAARMADDGAPEGTAVVAREQTAGRGRHGRSWSSPAGEGLYFSVIFRPDLPLERLWQIAFVASLAAAEAVREVSGLDARLKWPNDVLIGGRKVCGILVEARRGPAPDFHPTAIVGIGINVNTCDFPPEIAEKATSVSHELGNPVAIRVVQDALLSRIDARYSEYLRAGFAPILSAWRELDCTAGRKVAVHTPEGVIEGRAVRVSNGGDLVIQTADCGEVSVTAGDVVLHSEEDPRNLGV